MIYLLCVCAHTPDSVVSDSWNCMNCSPPGSSVHGIFQAKILEPVAISSSMGYSQPRDQTHVVLCLLLWQVVSLPLSHQGSPCWVHEKPYLCGSKTITVFNFRLWSKLFLVFNVIEKCSDFRDKNVAGYVQLVWSKEVP